MSPGSEDRDGVALDLKLLGFRLLPIVLITVLRGGNRPINVHRNVNEATGRNEEQFTGDCAVTYVTEVKSVNSGLDEEGIVWGQARLELGFLIFCLVVQLQQEQKEA